MLWLQEETGELATVRGEEFARRVGELAQPPRLVVLASCESAGSEKKSVQAGVVAGQFVPLAPLLAEAGVHAVLAMQGQISMETVKAAMPVFFSELLVDGQIDRAMARARGRVRERPDSWMPALFLRLKNGRIWQAGADVGAVGDYATIFQIFTQAASSLPSLIRIADFQPFVDGRTRNFVGREFFFAAVDEALADEDFPSGYIVIRGEPGVGKSALMGMLVKRRGCVHHFNISPLGIRSPQAFLSNVCAQLIVRVPARLHRAPASGHGRRGLSCAAARGGRGEREQPPARRHRRRARRSGRHRPDLGREPPVPSAESAARRVLRRQQPAPGRQPPVRRRRASALPPRGRPAEPR